MEPQIFVNKIKEYLVNEFLNDTIEMLENRGVDTIPENDWGEVLRIYHNLNEKSKKAFKSFLRQNQIDLISLFLGILDGKIVLDTSYEDFVLTTTSGKYKINDDLQDLFLAMEEE